jgi:hypothetical protein
MSNWKDTFGMHFDLYELEGSQEYRVQDKVKHFIETEIIEKLIEEAKGYFTNDFGMAKELRAKWLGTGNIIAGVDFSSSLNALDKLGKEQNA